MNCNGQPWAIEIRQLPVVPSNDGEFKFRVFEIKIDHTFLRGVEFLDSILKGFFPNSEGEILKFIIPQARRYMEESVKNYNAWVQSPVSSILIHFQRFRYQQEHNDLRNPNPRLGKGFYRDLGQFIINTIFDHENRRNPIDQKFVSYLKRIRSNKRFQTLKALKNLAFRRNNHDQKILKYILTFKRDLIFDNNFLMGYEPEKRTVYGGKLQQLMDHIFFPVMIYLNLQEFMNFFHP